MSDPHRVDVAREHRLHPSRDSEVILVAVGDAMMLQLVGQIGHRDHAGGDRLETAVPQVAADLGNLVGARVRAIVVEVQGAHVEARLRRDRPARQQRRMRTRPLDVYVGSLREQGRELAQESRRVLQVLDEVRHEGGGRATTGEDELHLLKVADQELVIGARVLTVFEARADEGDVGTRERDPFAEHAQVAVAGADVEEHAVLRQVLEERQPGMHRQVGFVNHRLVEDRLDGLTQPGEELIRRDHPVRWQGS